MSGEFSYVISQFDFEGRTLVLIVSVPVIDYFLL